MLRLELIVLFHLLLAAKVCSLQKHNVTATLADGTTVIGYEAEGLDTFQGIPYAQPPVGNLRLKPPQPLTAPLGTVDATQTAKACPQLIVNLNSSSLLESVAGRLINTPFGQNTLLGTSEDCLTINVIRPPSAAPGDNLPVIYWVFGGGFELGWSSLFNGSSFVADSITMGKPVVWVAVNYRVGGFGLMPGKELLAEGSTNLALRDQRLGLQWTAEHITQFGGDPDKVTIFGESAGSISVHLQMAYNGGDNTYNGKPLFRGAIMDSGSVIPYARVDAPQAQQVYDSVVRSAGCEGSRDTLACLRSLSYQDYLNAATSVPALFDYDGGQLSYSPRPDGDVIQDTVDVLSAAGRYARVPFIIGDQEDEGTLFSLTQTNLTTTDDLVTYLNDFYFPQTDRSVVEGYVGNYPDSDFAGSPYGTGPFNNVYPQFKRLAALLGDQLFTLQRRRVLQLNAQLRGPPAWTYLAKYFYGTPILGTFHATDILHGFDYVGDTDAKKTMHAYYLSFVNTLDPNNGTDSGFTEWPQWTEQGREILELGNSVDSKVGTDDFREEAYQYLLANIGSLHTKSKVSVLTAHNTDGPWMLGNPPQDLYRIGVLESSTAVVLSHATFLDSRGAALLRTTNQHISVTPESESKHKHLAEASFYLSQRESIHVPLASVPALAIPTANLSIKVHYGHLHPTSHHVLDQASLGVDTHFTFSTDILTQARLWLQSARYRTYQNTIERWHIPKQNPFSVNSAFLLATRNGGLALGRKDLGVVAPGATADLVVWDGRSPALLGWGDPVAAIILHASVGDIEHVLIGGDFRKRDRKLVVQDYARVQERFLASAERIQGAMMEIALPVLQGTFLTGSPYGHVLQLDAQRDHGNGYGPSLTHQNGTSTTDELRADGDDGFCANT